MTPGEVVAWLDKIKGMTDDPEAAHSEEKQLWAAVLAAISKGAPDPSQLAALALCSQDIDFPRWTS